MKNFCVYIMTTSCKFWFKQLCTLFVKNETELKQCLSSIEPKTWIITTFAFLTDSKNEWDNNCGALITYQICIKEFTMVCLTLSKPRATISTMVWTKSNFIVNLNKPCWASNSLLNKIARAIGRNLSSLDCWHACGIG